MSNEKPSEQKQKWFWMMDYCKKNRIPPAQKWAWDRAEEEYHKQHDNNKKDSK